MNDSTLREQNKRTVLMALWAVLICCVVIGSLLPASSPVMVGISRLHINDKVMHFCAYLTFRCYPSSDSVIAATGSL
jgi:hypothetical protein